jgi:folate-dependent phosphoribosylglycinamide formyltransferase PurN
MNIVLFTQNEPIYLPRYLEPIVSHQSDRMIEIVLAPLHSGLRKKVDDLYELVGPTAFVRFGLKYVKGSLVDLLPTKLTYPLSGRYHSVPSLAAAYDIPVRTVDDINDEGVVRSFREHDPDLFLSVACGQRMGDSLLSVPTRGAVNLHGSLLPEYRGLSTAFWVLYHGESESGVTAHFMDSTLDTGPIIEQRRFPVRDGDSMHDVYLRLADFGGRLANDVIDDLARGTVRTRSNESDAGEYFSRPTAEERREFVKRGNEFI